METAPALLLEEWLERGPVLVGVGNRWRGDDAAGPMLVARLAGRAGVPCVDAGDAPERHLGEIAAAGRAALLVDTVDFGGAPGEVALFRQQDLAAGLASTHTCGLGLLMRYLEVESGQEALLVGIQPGSVGFGEPLSAPVAAAVAALSGLIEARLRGPAIAAAPAGARKGG